MEDSSQDKNLPASGRKIQKARDDGQIARSRDLTHLAVLGCGIGAIAVMGPGMMTQLKVLLATQLRFDANALVQSGAMGQRLAALVEAGLHAWLPLATAVAVASILATVAAGGWIVTFKPLFPDVSRISPMEGLKRLFSTQQLAETAKIVVLMAVMSALGWQLLSRQVDGLVAMLLQSLPTALSDMGSTLLGGALILTGVVALVAAVDVPLQVHLHGARLRMSHQEMKQEHKESDGNPLVKGRRRALARELSQRSSVAAVKDADLIVMNPTHYAVALRYDEATMRAPRVVAKGADLVAMRMRDMAKSCAVPVLAAPMLARALYANAQVDQEVPAALYTAVAQVLAYVYQLKAAMRGEGAAPPQFHAPSVPRELDPHSKPGHGSAT